MDFKKATQKIIEDLKNEDIKFLHLIDRVGLDNIISEIKELNLINKISVNYENITNEDNLDIVSHIVHIENPFIKESLFRDYYRTLIKEDLILADINSVLDNDIISGENLIKEGLYLNPFTGMEVLIKTSSEGSLANIAKLSDRNFKENEQSIVLDINDKLISPLKESFEDFNLEFTLNHELAHLTAVQVFTPSVRIDKNIDILKESHSDVCACIKIILDNKLSEKEATDFIENLITKRSNLRSLPLEFISDINYNVKHISQPSLILLKDLINKEFNLIKSLDIKEIANFSILIVEQSINENYLNLINEEINIIPKNKLEVYNIFNEIKNGEKSFLGEIIKSIESKYKIDASEILSDKLTNNSFSKFIMSAYLINSIDKNVLTNIKFPYSDMIIENIKNDFIDFKIEKEEANIIMSEFFDYNELNEKTKSLKYKNY